MKPFAACVPVGKGVIPGVVLSGTPDVILGVVFGITRGGIRGVIFGVIPAQAGIHGRRGQCWIPACAGMTRALFAATRGG